MTDEDIVTHLAAMERRLLAAVTAQTAPKGDLILKPPGSLLSTEEAAVFLRISPESLRQLCRRKAITFIQVMPSEYRFHPEDLDEYVNSRRNRRKSVFQ